MGSIYCEKRKEKQIIHFRKYILLQDIILYNIRIYHINISIEIYISKSDFLNFLE